MKISLSRRRRPLMRALVCAGYRLYLTSAEAVLAPAGGLLQGAGSGGSFSKGSLNGIGSALDSASLSCALQQAPCKSLKSPVQPAYRGVSPDAFIIKIVAPERGQRFGFGVVEMTTLLVRLQRPILHNPESVILERVRIE